MVKTEERATAVQEERRATGAGWVSFASVVMILGGIFAFFEGLTALLRHGSFYHATSGYPLGNSVTAWGWTLLIVGVIVFLAGFAVMTGAMWARLVGIAIASLSAIANFFFIPYYPFWAVILVTINVFVIWALAAHGKALAGE